MECPAHDMHEAYLFILYMWLVILNDVEILHRLCLTEEWGSFWCSLDVSHYESNCQTDRQLSIVSAHIVVPS